MEFLEGLAADAVITLIGIVVGLPLAFLGLHVVYRTDHLLEQSCPRCGRGKFGPRLAPRREQLLFKLSSGGIGLLAMAAVLLFLGIMSFWHVNGPAWGLFVAFAVCAAGFYWSAKGMARYRTFPLQRCADCKWVDT